METATAKQLSNKQLGQYVANLIAKNLGDQEIPSHQLKAIFSEARKNLKLRSDRPRALPNLLSEEEERRFCHHVDHAKNSCHRMMILLMMKSGIRVNELVNIKVEHVKLGKQNSILIHRGKGDKSRLIPIDSQILEELTTFLTEALHNHQIYLFETKYQGKTKNFTTRAVELIVRKFADRANIAKRVYPHLFRHAFLTHLTKQNMQQAKIQRISGHSSSKSLEWYQQLNTNDFNQEFQQAMNTYQVN